MGAGDVSKGVKFRPRLCIGGWNVHGWDKDGGLVYECLHLHEFRRDAEFCAKVLTGEAAEMAGG